MPFNKQVANLLLVDDEAVVRFTVSTLLAAQNFKVKTVATVSEALDLIHTEKCHKSNYWAQEQWSFQRPITRVHAIYLQSRRRSRRGRERTWTPRLLTDRLHTIRASHSSKSVGCLVTAGAPYLERPPGAAHS